MKHHTALLPTASICSINAQSYSLATYFITGSFIRMPFTGWPTGFEKLLKTSIWNTWKRGPASEPKTRGAIKVTYRLGCVFQCIIVRWRNHLQTLYLFNNERTKNSWVSTQYQSNDTGFYKVSMTFVNSLNRVLK